MKAVYPGKKPLPLLLLLALLLCRHPDRRAKLEVEELALSLPKGPRTIPLTQDDLAFQPAPFASSLPLLWQNRFDSGGAMFCTQCGRTIERIARFCPTCGAAVSSIQPPPDWHQNTGQLTRPLTGRMLGGVCAAFALRYGWDVAVTRIITALLILCTCVGILVYIAAWIVIPTEFYPFTTRSNRAFAKSAAGTSSISVT